MAEARRGRLHAVHQRADVEEAGRGVQRLWGGHFVTFAKQAKPLSYFDAVKYNFLGAGEAGAIETAKAIGDDYPLGITANAYDASTGTTARRSTRTTSRA